MTLTTVGYDYNPETFLGKITTEFLASQDTLEVMESASQSVSDTYGYDGYDLDDLNDLDDEDDFDEEDDEEEDEDDEDAEGE